MYKYDSAEYSRDSAGESWYIYGVIKDRRYVVGVRKTKFFAWLLSRKVLREKHVKTEVHVLRRDNS